jgi:IPT/TIG domain-containing protein
MRNWMKYGIVPAVFGASTCLLAGSAVARPLVPAPTIISFTPTHALVGARVTIYGHNLTGAQVQFNGMTATNVTVDAAGTHATAVVNPETMDGPGAIGVITPGGTVTSSAVFTVEPPTAATAQTGTAKNLKPRIASIAPMRGKAGTKVAIKGTYLGGARFVKFAGVKALYTVPKASEIIARVPKNARSGKITILTQYGSVTGTARFTVVG